MAAISFTGLLLGLLLSSVASGDSIADANQAGEIGTLAKVDRFPDGGLQHHDGSRTLTTSWSKMLRGRKMGVDNVVKREAMKVKGAKKSGANRSVEKCDHQWEGGSHVGCALSDRVLPLGVSLVDLMPFSSDYRGVKGDCKISTRNPPGKSHRSMNNQDTLYVENRRGAPRLSNTQELGSRVSEASSTRRSQEPDQTHSHSLLDAATEISNMLIKDYGHKARSRAPVHNHQTLNHKNDSP